MKFGLSKHEKMVEYHVHVRSTDQFKHVGVREKNDRNEINSVGSPHLTFDLRKHLPITSGFSFLFCCGRSRFNFQDDFARLHNYEYSHKGNDD